MSDDDSHLTNIDTIPHMDTVLIVLSYVESIEHFILPLITHINRVEEVYGKREKRIAGQCLV